MKIFFTLLFLLITQLSFSQIFVITGCVRNIEDSTVLPFANVIFENELGRMINGSTTDFDGIFKMIIDKQELTTFKLKITANCFKTSYSEKFYLQNQDTIKLNFWLLPFYRKDTITQCPNRSDSCCLVKIYYLVDYNLTRKEQKFIKKNIGIYRYLDQYEDKCWLPKWYCMTHKTEY